MINKKEKFSISLFKDAIKNIDPNSQKAVNYPTSKENRFDDLVSNYQRGASEEVFSKNENNYSEENISESISKIDYIKWFSDITNKDVQTAGGKGASLGEMFRNKFPVPPGYVITAQAYDYFLKMSDLNEKINEIISDLNVDDISALNEASKKIRDLIENGKMPLDLKEEILENYKILSAENFGGINYNVNNDAMSILKNSYEPIFVSVRSSATTEDLANASFAGQQDSFLNVKGEASLIEYIKKCFSSLYTSRAIFYRKKKGFYGALIAVVVQKMIDSEKSGVVFSRDPVKQDNNITVEAVYGLGEGIVSGRINPDNYIVDRNLEVKNIKISNKKVAIVRTASGANEIVRLSDSRSNSQVMTLGEIKEIANFAMRLEEHYNKPQDIEFALEGGEMFIIQSRPITTLGKKQEHKSLKGNIVVEGLAASPGIGVGIVKIINSMEDLVNIKKGDVMVAQMTNPDMVVSMQKSAAIVTDEGGMTSHAAIVSREMGIPAIVGTGNATSKLKNGMKITVDGFNGKVFEGTVAEASKVEIKKIVNTNKIKLKVILDLPDYADRTAESGIDSIGLTRLEGIIASLGKHPLWYEKNNKLNDYKKLLEEGLNKIVKPFKSVWIRASDIRTDEYSNLEGAPEREINPMLGFHGVRFSLKHPEILKAELEAVREIAKINPEKKLGVMFPQIISIEEVKEAKKYFDEFKMENMEFGVMIETPAAVQIIDDIVNYVDFVSFGTNDLTQYTLAIDRGEDNVQYLYNDLHPAVLSQLGKVIDVCNRKNVNTSICGQAGSKKEMVKFLFIKGIKSISVNADAAFEISEFISELEKNDPSFNNKFENSNNSNNNSSDEQRKMKNKKKWEKFKKWKERKRLEKINMKKENINNSNIGWGKKGELALPYSVNENLLNRNKIKAEIIEDEKQLRSELGENNNLLDETSVKIPAEKESNNIEDIDDIGNIEEISDEIMEDVDEKNNEKLEEKHRIEDNIEITEEMEDVEEG